MSLPARMTETAESKVGKYEILHELGRGAVGVVYRGLDTVLERAVAIKVMKPDATLPTEMESQLRDEAKAVARLNHPNIVTIHEFAEDEGAPYLVMELLEGDNLEQRLRRGLPTVIESVELVVQICRGLGEAHHHQIVHRDIKPANVFISKDGVVKVMDFGMARVTDSDSPSDGLVCGTGEYMSPEQALGKETDHRTDIFAVGVILYRLLTGVSPFAAPRLEETLLRVVREEVHDVPYADGATRPELEYIVLRALAKDASKRYQSTDDLMRELADWLALNADEETASSSGAMTPPPMDPEQALRYVKQHTRTEADFPVLRQTAVSLMKLPEGGDAARVVDIVLQDPGLTSKVLKIANSAYFNRSQPVDSLHRAVAMLGLDLIRDACLGLGFAEGGEQQDPRIEFASISSRAFFGASLGREIGRACEHPNTPEVFTGSLLHHLPRMAIAYHLPDVYLYIEQLVDSNGMERSAAERAALTVPLVKIGRSIGTHWKLPKSLVEAMSADEAREKLERARSPEAVTRAAAVVSNALADEILGRSARPERLQELLTTMEKSLSIGEGAAIELIGLAHKQALEFAKPLGLDLKEFQPPRPEPETVRSVSGDVRDALLRSLADNCDT